MCRTRWITWSLCCVMLLVSFGCKDSSKSDGGAGRGGSGADSGAAGQDAAQEPRMDAGQPDDREAGAGGVGGKASGNGGKGGAAVGGRGGTGGRHVDDEDSGLPDLSRVSEAGDATYDQCLNDAQSAGQTVDDCTHCLCHADKCQAELNAATHDTDANQVVICSEEKKCTDLCCLCGDSSCSLSNYATGPCAAEVESAAGVTPGRGVIANGATVNSKCARDAKDDNACRRVAVLAQCELDKCADACPIATTCR